MLYGRFAGGRTALMSLLAAWSGLPSMAYPPPTVDGGKATVMFVLAAQAVLTASMPSKVRVMITTE